MVELSPRIQVTQAIKDAFTEGVTEAEILDMVGAAIVELRPGVIDLPAAARKYQVPRRIIRSWIEQGKLTVKGRTKSMVPGNELTFVSDAEVGALAKAHRVYDELPPGAIDLPSAARKYELHPKTVHDWVEKGYVKSLGRLRGSARGGGFVIVRENDLMEYIHAPRKKGGRPPKIKT